MTLNRTMCNIRIATKRLSVFLKTMMVFAATVPLLCIGCSDNRRSGGQGRNESVQREIENGVDFIRSAFNYTLDTQRFESDGFKAGMVESLDNWIRNENSIPNWKPDPMLDEIDQQFKKLPSVMSVSDMAFQVDDADFLQEAIWLKSVADRAAAHISTGDYQYMVSAATNGLEPKKTQELLGAEDQLLEAIRVLHPELSADESEYLTWTCRLFDWTVRNIQLDLMPVTYEIEQVKKKAVEMVDIPTGNAPLDGVLGPGYTKTVGDVINTGKGDLWQKSRLFTLLCRQLSIDVVMLNVSDRNDSSKMIPWSLGALIGGKIFLFDMKMGLPIPAKNYRRIATYEEVIQDPSILTQLRYKVAESTDDDPDYRIIPSELETVHVWLDASEESLSQRMQLLEPKLTGDFRVAIQFQPSKVKDQLKENNFASVSLSPLPFRTRQYMDTFESALTRKKPEAIRRNYLQRTYFDIKIPIKKVVRKDRIDEATQSLKSGQEETIEVTTYLLAEARHRFLLGVFGADVKSGKNTLGARKLRDDIDAGRDILDASQMFMDLALDDERIDEILSDKDWVTMMGLDAQNDLDAKDQENFFSIFEAVLRLIRTDSSIWLGLSSFETDDFGNAKNWFSEINRFDKSKRWTFSAGYNLARSQEALYDYQSAIDSYREMESPQKFGNIIRARLIQRWNLGDEKATEPE